MVAITYLATSVFAQIAIVVVACYGLYESIRHLKSDKNFAKKINPKWIIILIISVIGVFAGIGLLLR